jgi:hypothetical protein
MVSRKKDALLLLNVKRKPVHHVDMHATVAAAEDVAMRRCCRPSDVASSPTCLVHRRAASTPATPRRAKYTLDTNIFLYGFRDSDVAARLEQFHQAHAPFEQLSAVVAHELQAGAHTLQAAAALVQTEGLVLADVRKSFTNDVVLAVSCHKRGITLVTANDLSVALRRLAGGMMFARCLCYQLADPDTMRRGADFAD